MSIAAVQKLFEIFRPVQVHEMSHARLLKEIKREIENRGWEDVMSLAPRFILTFSDPVVIPDGEVFRTRSDGPILRFRDTHLIDSLELVVADVRVHLRDRILTLRNRYEPERFMRVLPNKSTRVCLETLSTGTLRNILLAHRRERRQ